MFEEFLSERGLHVKPGLPFPRAADRASWDAIPSARRDEILHRAEQALVEPYPQLTAAEFMAYQRTGDRRAYEVPCFARRSKIIWMALGACVSREARFLDALIDGIWLVCEESFWGVSAHNPDGMLPDVDEPYIDLFAAQTGALLQLCCWLLGDELDSVSPRIVQRVRGEIKRRILDPFMTRDDFWWMGKTRKDVNNWTTWIVSNVLICMLASGADGLDAGFWRALMMLDAYLRVVPGDGGIDEGVAYWNMAGGSLLDCLELLRFAGEGAPEFYAEPKIQNIARFPLAAHISGEWFLNFADCDAKPNLDGERVYRFGERIGDSELMALGAMIDAQHPALGLRDTPEFSRLLNRIFNPLPPMTMAATGDYTLPDTGLWIRRRGAIYAAIKAGHNQESHNHNDVGSFVVYKDGEPLLIDVGNMTYTKQTFSGGRYELMNTRSMNHNLPLIGSFEQVEGRERRAEAVVFKADSARMDIAKAYPDEAGVKSLVRTLSISGESAILSDEITLNRPQPVTWVFMLRDPGAIVLCDASLKREIDEIPVTDARLKHSFPGSIWRLTITAPPSTEHVQEFILK